MKKIDDFIIEELILEYIIGKCNDFKIKFDLSLHGDERQNRDNKHNNFISKKEISYTLYKISKQIRDDYDLKNIKENDNIGIIDKSRNVEYNCVCLINIKDDFIILKVITHEYKNNFIFKDCVKIYNTYINDKKIEKEYKPSNIF